MKAAKKIEQETPLRLRAATAEDIAIFASCLQDALVPAESIHFDGQKKQLCLLANRFCWERGAMEHQGTPMYQRTHTALHFTNVTRVQHQGFSQERPPHTFLSLLTIRLYDAHTIDLFFADHIAFRVHADKIGAFLEDYDAPWWTHHRPHEEVHLNTMDEKAAC